MNAPLAVKVKTAAQMTELSETEIRKAIDARKLPAFRVGRAIRIHVADLETWVRGLTVVGSEDDQ